MRNRKRKREKKWNDECFQATTSWYVYTIRSASEILFFLMNRNLMNGIFQYIYIYIVLMWLIEHTIRPYIRELILYDIKFFEFFFSASARCMCKYFDENLHNHFPKKNMNYFRATRKIFRYKFDALFSIIFSKKKK